MGLPKTDDIRVGNQRVTLNAFNGTETKEHLRQTAVQIIASGPSIADLVFNNQQLGTPTIFVNGSLSLLSEQTFTSIAGWVISDARFIHHQPNILKNHYNGQPLYATLAVFEALAASHPEIMLNYHQAMRVLYPVDRPWGVKSNKPWHSKLALTAKRLIRKSSLKEFADHPSFVINSTHKPKPIGVSLDVTDGFVEAGTVAYVAAQLAFSRQASAIHLYGIDLLNSNQPRFYENKDNSAPCKLDKAITDRIVPSFNLLGKVYKDHGVTVYNHSPVSKDLFDELY
ncbi:hypothetical protein [Psychrobacter sp. AOP3-A1-26]|uniref:hypothetical protein n=1 Tax=Psychrobacter sp. AOP3-A1-26 TaxID=3457700 RepID=UPI00264D4DFD|nr:hypothetical protein [Psychrobacter sp.]